MKAYVCFDEINQDEVASTMRKSNMIIYDDICDGFHDIYEYDYEQELRYIENNIHGCDALILFNGWKYCNGCKLARAVALQYGIKIIYNSVEIAS